MPYQLVPDTIMENQQNAAVANCSLPVGKNKFIFLNA